VSVAVRSAPQPTQAVVEVVAILTSFIVGSTLCGVLFAGLTALGRRHATGNVMRWIDALCGAALSFFGRDSFGPQPNAPFAG